MSLISFGQTTTLPYNDDVYTSGFPSVTLNNFSSCQTSASITTSSQGYSGIWADRNYNVVVNGTNIGTYLGTQTIDISTYLPITSVQMNGLFSSWSWVDLTVNITSNNASMPVTGPTVTNITYVQGDIASPLSATLNSTGTTLKWYTDQYGDNYSATAPTPSTASVGTTSYYVSQANASACESVRSVIVVTVVPNTPATHLNFDGTNDYVNLGTSLSSALNGSSAFTLEAWINPSVLNGWNNIITDYDGTYGKFLLRVRNNNNIQFVANSTFLNSPFTVPLNTWTHIAAVYDGVNMFVYANGVLIASQAAPASLPSGTPQINIGSRIGSNTENFTGNIDDVRVWNIARTPEQINGSKNCELQGTEPGLLAYYKFNQGVDLANNSGVTNLNATTGPNGTLTNFALNGATSNWKAGSAVTSGSIVPSVATVTTPVIYNQGDTAAALSATTGTNGTGLLWYTTATGGVGTATAPTPSTASAGSTSYWVTSTNANGCESPRTEIVVNVNANATHLNFDGVDDVINLGPALTTYFTGRTQVSLQAWVRPETNAGLGTIVGNYNYPSNINALQMMLRRDGANYTFWIDGGSGYSAVSAVGSVVINTWQHITGTWDGTTMRIYVNGVLANSSAKTGTIPSKTTSFSIGSNFSERFDGDIDEVRIWNKALTATDITNTMNCEAMSQPELVTYYKFNQGHDNTSNTSITSLTDSAGSNNGTLTNFTLSGNISNWKSGSVVSTGNTCTVLENESFNVSTNFKIYPNPTKNIVNIDVLNLDNISVEVYDINGRQLFSQKLNNTTNTVNIENLAAGVYMFKVISNQGTATNKVIKQ